MPKYSVERDTRRLPMRWLVIALAAAAVAALAYIDPPAGLAIAVFVGVAAELHRMVA